VREQTLLVAVLDELRKSMPFELLGFDTDNDSVFINETVRDYCTASGIAFTRCRPYRKNDQAWVEQKNGSVVRRLVGYRRFEGLAATAALADLYAAARLFVNFFQPSFKLAEKHREGTRVHKRYHPPATPHQRLLDDPRTDGDTREWLGEIHAGLDPVRLLRDIRAAQQRLVALADALNCPLVALLEGEGSTPLAVLLHTGSLPWEQRQAMPTDPGKLPLDVPWEGEAFLATPAPNTRFAPLKTGDLALLGPTTRFHHAGHYLIQRDEMTEITHLLQAPSTTTPLCGVLLAHWRKQ
jgi:hypothetical protein